MIISDGFVHVHIYRFVYCSRCFGCVFVVMSFTTEWWLIYKQHCIPCVYSRSEWWLSHSSSALRIEKETQKWIWDLGVNRRPSPYTHHHTIMSIPKVIIKHFSLSNCVYVLVLLFPECYCLKVYLCTKLCRPQVRLI